MNIFECINEKEIEIKNVNFSDENVEKVEYVYDFSSYGVCYNEENCNKLKPFVALCRIFNIMHKKYNSSKNYDEIIKMCKFLEKEIKMNLKNTY